MQKVQISYKHNWNVTCFDEKIVLTLGSTIRSVIFNEKDISKESPSIVELQRMLSYQNGNLKKLFNTSGLLYQEMHLKDKLHNLSTDEAFALLNQYGMLVKRPFLIGDHFGFIGFKETEWSKKFS